MDRQHVHFVWEGKKYKVDIEASRSNGSIILPDGRALMVGIWLQSLPPIPDEIVEYNHVFKKLPVKIIAVILRGRIAELIV